MTYSTYMGEPIYDYFIHAAGVTDYPAGSGATTTTLASGVAPLGTRVVLHMILPLNGFTTATPITILKGDGSTAYFTPVTPGNANGMSASIDILLNDGLSVSGGSGGPYLISYRILD